MEIKYTKERIHKFSKIIYILAKVGKIGCYVGIGLCIAGFIWMMAMGRPDGSIKVSSNFVIEAPTAGLSISEDGNELPMNITAVSALLSYLLTVIIFSLCIFRHVEQLFRRIYTSHTPFEMDNARQIRKISILMILVAIIPNIVGVSVGATLSRFYDSTMHIKAYNSFDIFVVLMFFCVAEIFNYGCELQQQADETL